MRRLPKEKKWNLREFVTGADWELESGGLVSRLITPISHKIAPFIPVI